MSVRTQPQDKSIGKRNNEQGALFEDAFSNHMLKELGYLKAERGTAVHSYGNPRGIEVDIIGKKFSKQGNQIRLLSRIMLALSLCIMAFPFVFWQLKVILIEVFLVPSTAFVLVLLSAYLMSVVNKYSAEYTWVECKSSKDKTTYEEVSIMISKYKDHMECSGELRYNFRDKFFVSANGFIDTALKRATDNGIICYICKEGKFVKID